MCGPLNYAVATDLDPSSRSFQRFCLKISVACVSDLS